MWPGSSPHARGAPSQVYGRIAKPRIIPACAGSTYLLSDAQGQARDHPRMRGEHRGGCHGCC